MPNAAICSSTHSKCAIPHSQSKLKRRRPVLTVARARPGPQCAALAARFGRIQYSAVEDHLLDPGIGVNRLRRILSEQEQIGTFSDLHGTDFPIQLQCPCGSSASRTRRSAPEFRPPR